MIKRFFTRWLFKLLDGEIKLDYLKIDKAAMTRWLFESYEDKGFKHYFQYHDLKILKEMGFGVESHRYWMLVGRRLQLLSLYEDMKKSWDFEKKRRDQESRKSKDQEDAG